MSTQQGKKLHIAMFPWLAFGHMLPYLELAKLISQKGHRVSFISTPNNIRRLPKLPISLQIAFVPLQLPRLRNLPPDAEATSDLSERQAALLKRAHDGLRDQVKDFLGSTKPDWILFDFAAYWLPDAAREVGVNCAIFSTFNAAAVGFLVGPEYPDGRTIEDFAMVPKWVPFESSVAFRRFDVKRILDESVVSAGSQEEEEEEVSVLYRGFHAIRGSDVIAIRSSWEFEPEWLKLLEDVHRKPVVPVGQLPPTPCFGDDEDGKESDTWQLMRRWLDEIREKSSVVYVAFGSEAKPSQAELDEIALGLEMSGLPFLWVLRTRRGEFDPDPVRLPDGFETRVEDRGLICTEWAPQKKILAHDSVGGMMTHVGWSSVVEAVGRSRPLIMLTFSNDQALNARLLEEKGVGYSVPRDENDGSFRREDIAESVELVIVKEEGQVYRDKAKELSPIFGSTDIQDRYVDAFLGHIMNY